MDSEINWDALPVMVTGMANQAYHQKKEFDGRSFLCSVQKGGGEAQLWMDQGRSLFGGNSATTTGSEFDEIVTGVLGGKKFDDMVVVPPDDVLGANGSRSTKAYKEWAATQTGICVTADKRWQYAKMLDAMRGNDSVYELMTLTTRTQLSVFFEAYGHRLKVRPDACTEGLWWDLKTTSSPWDRLFRSALDYGYLEQDWLYQQGAYAIGYPPFRMPFVFVQTMPPFCCRVFVLPEQMVAEAGKRLISTMEEVRLRRSTGAYVPADAEEIHEMAFPQWATRQEEVVEL
jgi:hypothetical protein